MTALPHGATFQRLRHAHKSALEDWTTSRNRSATRRGGEMTNRPDAATVSVEEQFAHRVDSFVPNMADGFIRHDV